MKYLRAIRQFCSFLFIPQMGKERRKMEKLKQNITYLIGKEREEGNLETLSSQYISRVLNVPLEDVEKCMKDMGM